MHVSSLPASDPRHFPTSASTLYPSIPHPLRFFSFLSSFPSLTLPTSTFFTLLFTSTRSPLCANMTSSVKPEVHNVSQQRHRRRTITTRSNNNNSMYRVARHNTRTWSIGAACETFPTPSLMLKRTIRTVDEGRWRRGLRLQRYSGVSAKHKFNTECTGETAQFTS